MRQGVNGLIWNLNLKMQDGLGFWGERISTIRLRDIWYLLVGALLSALMSVIFYWFILVITALVLGLRVFRDFLPLPAFFGLMIGNTLTGGIALAVNKRNPNLHVTARRVYTTAVMFLIVISLIALFVSLLTGSERLGHPVLWVLLVLLGACIPTCVVESCCY